MYAPSPALPLAPQRWDRVVRVAARDAAALVAKAVRTGHLGVGDASKYATLVRTLQALNDLSPAEAKIAATALQPLLTELATDLSALNAALPAHAAASVNDLTTFLGLTGQAKVVNVSALEATTVRTRMAMTKDWTRLAARTKDGIADAVTSAMGQGLGPHDAAKAMQGLVTDQGGLVMARAETIARTEMADLYDASRLGWMQDNPDLLDGWWWRARPDACPICQILHGQVFQVGDSPDRHHNCRCVMVPLPKGQSVPPVGDRRSREQMTRGLPKSWKLPDDLNTLVAKRNNPGWRPSLVLRRPAA